MANGSAKTIEIKDDANLGIAMLIAEFGEGSYQTVGPLRPWTRSWLQSINMISHYSC